MMNFTVRSEKIHKGFLLQNELNFDGYSCLITGKNGSGKTRLINGIISSDISVFKNGDKLSKHDIREINISNLNLQNFSASGTPRRSKVLAEKVHSFTSTEEELIDNHPIDFSNGRYEYDQPVANIKNIAENASLLFNKNAKELSEEEIQLSIILNKELINNIKGEVSGFNLDSLSQFSIDYLQAFQLNRMLKFFKSENENVTPLSDEKILKYIGENSPCKIFNDIINEMFRGKFHISHPDKANGHKTYTPRLILSSKNEEVNINDLSSGEKTIFWLAQKTFEIFMSSPDEFLKKSKLILLDEPDSRLHPLMILDFLKCLELLHKSLNIAFIFTTHSPTTVALMDSDNIYNIEISSDGNEYSINKQTKDLAISQLLDGVVQVSVNPENSRQIYVENSNDQSTYEVIYRNIKNISTKINKELPLTFISSGPKIHENELLKHITSVYGKDERNQVLITAINGDGDCEEVIGMVTSLVGRGNKTIRGIIDWDKKERNLIKEIIVFAKNYAYSIENVIYDPISLYAYNINESFHTPDHYFPCEKDYYWKDVVNDKEKLQAIVDTVTRDILGRDNNKNHPIKYFCGVELLGDLEYFIPTGKNNGHSLEDMIFSKYHALKKLIPLSKQSGMPKMYYFIQKTTIGLLGREYINVVFEDLFASID